ncbi:MAG: transcriptional regulator, CdaR family, partial [Frankiales bacterium]|nr:transcriptional regulator, CdaR family [Frankiales bacterium]
MPAESSSPPQALWRRLERASGRISTSAVRRMEELPWFQALPAVQRADVGLVVQASLAVFATWLRSPDAGPPASLDVFAAAPPELARHVTLKQTVQLIRIMVEVVEEHVPQLAPADDVPLLTEQVLRYSREVAFAAAEVYAAAAEARGAWDARVEAGVVEALVRGSVGELTATRATSLGWSRTDWVVALAASGEQEPAAAVERVRALARHARVHVLVGEAGGGLLTVLGGVAEQAVPLDEVAEALPPGPVVVGPTAPDVLSASPSVQEALAGLRAVAGWPDAPRPVPS